MEYLSEIIVAIVVTLLTTMWRAFVRGFRKQFYFKIFGGSVADEGTTNLIYSEFLMHPGIQFPTGITKPYAYIKPFLTPKVPTNIYSISKPISSCEIRAAKYLTEILSSELKIIPKLASDLELRTTTNINFISFGGPGSNLKTYDAIFHKDNNLVCFDNTRMWYIPDGQTLYSGPTATHDFGLIMNVRPTEHSNNERAWLVCAGFGEWGTSGAAYYLSRNWEKIAKSYGSKPFAIIVRVENNKDDSAEKVWASQTQ